MNPFSNQLISRDRISSARNSRYRTARTEKNVNTKVKYISDSTPLRRFSSVILLNNARVSISNYSLKKELEAVKLELLQVPHNNTLSDQTLGVDIFE